jgi:uncharacterized surface protein with fasciclin (FAS1) repeats
MRSPAGASRWGIGAGASRRGLGRLAGAAFVALTLAFLPGPVRAADILQRLGEKGHFSRFLMMIDRAGLSQQLAGPGPFTVFAPSDESFIEMEDGGGFTILLVQTAQLGHIVKYHVVPQALARAAMSEAMSLPTLHGKDVVVLLEGGAEVNGRAFQGGEITASNGTIHPIASLLLPPGL